MTSSAAARRGFLDCLMSPWVLLPVTAGFSLLIVAWVVPNNRQLLLFLAVVFLLVSVGALLTQWLVFSGGDSGNVQMRKDFLDSLETICGRSPRAPCQQAERGGTPAQVERV
jgi:hypothetical protein